jgi:LDH2 family malate/lactate/ureidoglycolate dehydrogenase
VSDTKLIPEKGLKEFGRRALEATGINEADAALAIDVLVEADMRGVYSHGVVRLPIYVERLKAGVMDPAPRMEVRRDKPSTCVFDGGNGIGMLVGVRSMEVAIEKARASEAPAFVAVQNSNHYGAAAYFAEQAADEGMFGFSFTIGGINHMAAWGGREPILGNNPFAIAMPTPCGFNVVLDMACSVAARGKIIVAAKNGDPIPSDWALGPDGLPTTDANEALKGLVQPVGGPKGYALTLMIGLLSTMLTDAFFGSEVTHLYEDMENPQNIGHLQGAIPIDLFQDRDRYDARMEKAVREIQNTEKAAGADRVYMPGEREHLSREKALKDGVPLGAGVLDDLRATGKSLGIDFDAVVASHG